MSSAEKEKSKNGSNDVSLVDNALEIIIMISISLIVLFSLLSVFNVYLGTNAPVAVTTLSMSPVYGGFDPSNIGDETRYLPLDGDLLVIQKGKPQLGDTVVYSTDKNKIPIVHRIVGVENNSSGYSYYITKGDNNINTDHGTYNWISEEEVLGIVILRIPGIAWLSLEIQQLTMRLFLIVSLIILLILMLFDNGEEEEKKAKSTEKKKSGYVSRLLIYIFRKLTLKSFTKGNWKKKLFASQGGNIFVVSIIIFTLFTGFNLYKVSLSGNYLMITSQRGTESISESPFNEGGHHFLQFDLEINSQGIFNWIHEIELRLNGSDNEISYLWTIPYSYNEKLLIRSGVMISDQVINTGNNTFNLYFTIYSSGLLAEKPVEQMFSLTYFLN